MNTDESELALFRAERRVREIQAKLHRLGRPRPTAGLVERPLPGNGHGGCGRRLGETDGWKHRRAPRADPHPHDAPQGSRADHRSASRKGEQCLLVPGPEDRGWARTRPGPLAVWRVQVLEEGQLELGQGQKGPQTDHVRAL